MGKRRGLMGFRLGFGFIQVMVGKKLHLAAAAAMVVWFFEFWYYVVSFSVISGYIYTYIHTPFLLEGEDNSCMTCRFVVVVKLSFS